MKKANDLLKIRGRIGVIQWTQETERGPSLAIRPNQESCNTLGEWSGFNLNKRTGTSPHHFGLLFEKEVSDNKNL